MSLPTYNPKYSKPLKDRIHRAQPKPRVTFHQQFALVVIGTILVMGVALGVAIIQAILK